MNPQRQSLSIPVAIIIAGVLIAFGLYWSGRGTAIQKPSPAAQAPSLSSIDPIGPDDHVLGNPNAAIVLVEYSDIECPYCKQFHSTLSALMKEYGSKAQLAWAFRHYPVHNNSVKEGEATECAAELGGNDAFWRYLDKIFAATPSNDGLDLSTLPVLAKEVGIDEARFNECLASGKHKARILKDKDDVTAAGAQGTPYSVLFVNSQRIPITQGALPYEDMKNIIDTILKNL
ncbi:MAG: thioredoxin domain-containing protein [Candidatus Taylorbacteria bacterium]|nr:thioredoxin domain-containing protein [Candidatus Taylorbacteria bacterium]